jgi:hypothetical protein
MSMEFPLSQSPRTQAFQMPQAPEDENDMFTQGFSELAYRAFQKAQPELMSNVLTFRVLDVDVEEGTGIGTFILQQDQDIVFVPCVVSDNAIKPLDLFYSRTADRFYPFTTAWLRASSKDAINQLGGGVAPPKNMPTDVDIRNLVVPPTTGRYSYASDAADQAWLPFVVALRKEKIAERSSDPKFLELLSRSPDGLKVAFAKVLQRRPKLAKLFGEFYGAEKVAAVLSGAPQGSPDDAERGDSYQRHPRRSAKARTEARGVDQGVSTDSLARLLRKGSTPCDGQPGVVRAVGSSAVAADDSWRLQRLSGGRKRRKVHHHSSPGVDSP